MAAVSQRVSNYLGGVSNQPDDKKTPGQVQAANNVYPDPTFGLMKRPGFKFLTTLKDAASGTGGTDFTQTALDSGKWFFVNRNADEKYIGCIIGHKDDATKPKIHIWNAAATDFTKCAVTMGANGFNTSSDLTGEGSWSSANYAPGAYLLTDPEEPTAAKYDVLTIQDTYYIVNKNITVTAKTAPTYNANRRATVKLNSIEAGEYKIKFSPSGGTPETKSLQNVTTATTADTILDAFVSTTGSQKFTTANLTVSKHGNTLEFEYSTAAFELTVDVTTPKDALTWYGDKVNSINDLPAITKGARKVEIINTAAAAEDDYWVEYDSTNKVWTETIDPTVAIGPKETTMPHELVCTGLNTFTFQPVKWTRRLVGDDVTNAHPSFVGKKIQETFFYNNRIGFLTNNTVCLSQAGDLLNFYGKSAKVQTDADPIDLDCSSTRPVELHNVIPVAQGLMLFSSNQQFIMFSADGTLSPNTALIRSLSNYQMDDTIDPVDLGTHIDFVSKAYSGDKGYTRVFSMLPRGNQESPEIVDIGRTVSEYIPANISELTASPQNGFIAMYGKGNEEVYFYRVYKEGDRELIRAWFNWTLPGEVHYITAESDTMYAVVATDSKMILLSAALTLAPEETILEDSSGRKINPCMDFYAQAKSEDGTKTVDWVAPTGSTEGYSKVYLPFKHYEVLEPVIVISGIADDNFDGVTESGFTTGPEAVFESPRWYFKVPRKNLSQIAGNVFVGYRYEYDVTLPKTYFQLNPEGTEADFPANLVINRMKFSVGLASAVDFRLASSGVEHDYEIPEGPHTATALTTATHSAGPATAAQTLRNISTTSANGSASSKGTGMTVDCDISATGQITNIKVNKEGKGYKTGNIITLDKTSEGTGTTNAATATVGTLGTTEFSYNLKQGYSKKDMLVRVGGVKLKGYENTLDSTAVREWTWVPGSGGAAGKVRLNDPPGANVEVKIVLRNWLDAAAVQTANFYLADDIPLDSQSMFTIPIHQRTDNFNLRVYSDSPFPVSLTSMMWEGNYTPRYYRRT